MLKDLKEKVKNISEIVGMISVVGTIIVVITAALYNFGFFSYFSVNIWKLPITISEIITDVVVILPKLLLILVICSILLFIMNIVFFLIIEGYNFTIKSPSTSKMGKKSIMTKYMKKHIVLIFTIISFLYFLLIFISIILKNKNLPFNPCVMFSIWFFSFIIFILHGKIGELLFWLSFFLLMYFVTMISTGIYDANVESLKEKSDSIIKTDGNIVKDIRILKVYDTGIIVLSSSNNLDFFYSCDIKKYSIHTKENNIFRDDIIVNSGNGKNKQIYNSIKEIYKELLINYDLKRVLECIYDFCTFYADETVVQKTTNKVIKFLYKT